MATKHFRAARRILSAVGAVLAEKKRALIGLGESHVRGTRAAVEMLEGRRLLSAVSFAGKADYPTGSYSCGVVSGDFNGDNLPDLAVVNGDSATLSVLMNNGNGTFAGKADYQTASVPAGDGSGPFGVATGDFNGDRKLDLVTANGPANSVSVFLNDGTGGFAGHVDFPAGTGANDVVTGDFNLDGNLDLAVVNAGSNTISVLLGDGAGAFSAKKDYATGATPFGLTTGDFNGDSYPDLVVANSGWLTSSGNTVSVFLNKGDGTGTFWGKANYITGSVPAAVCVGDFTGDGKPDLAVANYGSGSVSVFRGTGTGVFYGRTDYAAGNNPQDITTGDFNADGNMDLAVANKNSNSVSVLAGNGKGAFAAKVDFASGGHPVSITRGDFDGDGRMDLASGNGLDNNVNVFLNQSSVAGWVAEGPINTARDQFAAGVVNGKIYVFGGNRYPGGGNLKSIEVFDPATHTWSYVANNEHNTYGNGGTEELTGASVNGKFYVFGAYGGIGPSGHYGDFNWVEEYDPGTDTWTSKAPKPTLVTGATCAVYNDEIYVFGGQYEDPTSNIQVHYNVVEAYNPSTDRWRSVTHMPQILISEAVAVVGHTAYVIGGVSTDAYGNIKSVNSGVMSYDFLANRWTTSGLAAMPLARAGSYASAAPVIDGKIYIIGGGTGTSLQNLWAVDSVEVYDPATNTWSMGPLLPGSREGCAVAVGNTIYAISGDVTTDAPDSDPNRATSSVLSWQVVNHAPVASDFSKSQKQNTPLAFTAADFKGAFSDPDAGNTLQTVQIISLPTNGTLTLGGVAVAQGDEIAAGQLGTLVYTPNLNYSGSDSFDWDGSDGALYAGAAATVNLTVNHYVPTVYLLKSVPTVYEATANSGGKGQMLLYRTKENLALPLTVSYSVGGTGVDGVNYSHLSGTVTFAAGKSTATIDVVPLEDGVADATLTVSATLTADPDAYAVIGAYQTASVSIVDDSPTVYLMKYVPVVYESKASSGGKGQMLLYRTGSTAGTLTVSYTVGGTGVDGVNYAHLGGTATFLAGKSTATIDVIPVEDGRADAALTVSATLIADGGPTYHVANAYKTAVVSIIDSAPTIYMWVSKPYAYKSGKGNGQFAVYRTGSTASQLTVNYSVLNGSTAVSGTNFTALTGQVTFGPGESMAYINLVGINDPNQVGYLTVKVGLVGDGGPSYRFGSTYNAGTVYVLNA